MMKDNLSGNTIGMTVPLKKVQNDENEDNLTYNEALNSVNNEDLKPITKKQELFLNALFVNNFNQTASYLSVFKGISYSQAKTYACTLMKKPNFQAALARKSADIAASENISKSKIIKTINSQIESCIEKDDKPNLVKFLDMLNKIAGHYTPAPLVNIGTQGDINISFGTEETKEIKETGNDFTEDISFEEI